MMYSENNTFLEHASNLLGDTQSGLTSTDIKKHIIGIAVECNIALPNMDKSPNKRTTLLQYLKAFPFVQSLNIINKLSKLPQFDDNDNVKHLRYQLMSKYDKLLDEKQTDTELVHKTRHWLQDYPEAFKLYENALKKYESGIFERNTLDDMRLGLELLLKSIYSNNKSLENQIAIIGDKLKQTKISPELRNTIIAIIKYYCDFQNNNVKHNEKFDAQEIEYIIEITSIIMKFLIKVTGKVSHKF